MEYRRIQKTGGASYIVTLPKEWIEKNGLKKGDEVSIKITEENEVLISPGKEIEKNKEIELKFKGENYEHILRILISTYISGFKIIKIKGDGKLDENIIKAVEKFRNLVSGYEIVDEKVSEIVLQDISNPLELLPDKLLERMYNLTENMVRDSYITIKNNDIELGKEIMNRDLQVDKIYLTISRQLFHKLRSPSSIEGFDSTTIENIRYVAKSLERISDHAVNMASLAGEFKNIRENVFDDFFNQTLNLLKNSYLSFENHNAEMANEIIDKIEENVSKIRDFIRMEKKIDTVYFSLLDSIIRILRYSQDICETAINDKYLKLS